MTLQDSPHQRLAFLDEGRHALHIAPVQRGVSEVRERQRSTRLVAKLLVEGDGLFEGVYGPPVVLLENADEAEPIERPGPGGGKLPGVSLESSLQPPLALLETLPAPEPPERGREAQPQPRALFLVTGLQGPGVRLAQVRELGTKAPEPQALIRPDELGFSPLGEGQIVLRVPKANLGLVRTSVQLLPPELPNGLQHPVAQGSPGFLDHDQRFVHERRQQIQTQPRLHRISGSYGF